MIDWISNWAEAIIIAVIIATIIEMILPEGSSKKYIKVVIGVYILFTIISPIITKFTGKTITVSDILDLDKYIEEVEERQFNQNIFQEDNSASIREIYIGNLKKDIEGKLKGKGYVLTEIELDVGYDDDYTLNKIILVLEKNGKDNENVSSNTNVSIENVNEINISISNSIEEKEEIVQKSNLSNSDIKELKEYLNEIYDINEKNVVIN